jgi:hypothetical protein
MPDMPGCDTCAHLGANGLTCKAFPQGIPLMIQSGDLEHVDPLEGDGGFQYKPVPASGKSVEDFIDAFDGDTKNRVWIDPYTRDGIPVDGYWRVDDSFDRVERGIMLSRVRQEMIDAAVEKRKEDGQGTGYWRNVTPVEGQTGTRDAILIQAKEFRDSLPAKEKAAWHETVRTTGPNGDWFGDTDIKLYDAKTRERLQRMTSVESGARVAVRVPRAVLPDVLSAGQILNAHDLGHRENDRSRKDAYMEHRSETERKVWHIDTDDPADHPVYGYVGLDNEDMDGGVRGFGDVKITLKDSVRPRTTITYSDSLFIGIGNADALPSPIDNPSSLSVAHFMNLRGVYYPVPFKGMQPNPEPELTDEEKKKLEQIQRWNPDGYDYHRREMLEAHGYTKWPSGDFIEAQIHGGITLADIERVDFPDNEIWPSVTKALDDLGIPWTVGGPKPSPFVNLD